MVFPRIASIVSFCGVLALVYIASAESQPVLNSKISSIDLATDRQNTLALSRGRVKLGGSAGIHKNEYSTVVNLAPSVHYFLIDRVTVGLDSNFTSFFSQFQSQELRPAVSYYFYSGEEIAAFVKQDIGYNSAQNLDFRDSYIDGRSHVGLDWFLNPWVAVTPSLSATYGHSEKPVYSGLLSFNVFL